MARAVRGSAEAFVHGGHHPAARNPRPPTRIVTECRVIAWTLNGSRRAEMNEETMHALTAMTIAITVLGTELERRGVLSKADLAAAYEQSAELLPSNLVAVDT